MDSLIGYGSEEDIEEPTYRKKTMFRQTDANYEVVQMDLSEDSSNSPKSDSYRPSKGKDRHSSVKQKQERPRKSDEYKSKYDGEKYSPKHDKSTKDHYKSRNKYRKEDNRSERKEDNRSERYKEERTKDNPRERSHDDKDRRRDERSKDYRSSRDSRDREDRYKESKSYDENKKYSRDKDRNTNYDSRDSSYRKSRNDSHESSRDESRSRKLSSPTRRHSRSPVRSDTSSKHSNSFEKNRSTYTSRYHDRNALKLDRLEKLGIELGTPVERASTSNYPPVDERTVEKNRFYMPGITGRFTEQIQRRKMLWQKKDSAPAEVVPAQQVPVGQPAKVWQNTTFAQDTDGKVANKFKRLMGIKGAGGATAKPATESLKKQEEMFTSMEAQYEVARTATHTMRGVGLGFGSFQK